MASCGGNNRFYNGLSGSEYIYIYIYEANDIVKKIKVD
jgi:hypothetical protein